jgi:hypothetical protein
LSHLFNILAVVIAAIVAASKYFNVAIPSVTEWAMRDPIASLLIALVLALLAQWL